MAGNLTNASLFGIFIFNCKLSSRRPASKTGCQYKGLAYGSPCAKE